MASFYRWYNGHLTRRPMLTQCVSTAVSSPSSRFWCVGSVSMLIGVDSVRCGRYPSSTCRRPKTSRRARLCKDSKVCGFRWNDSRSTLGYLVYNPSYQRPPFPIKFLPTGIAYWIGMWGFKIRTRQSLLGLDSINSFLHRRISRFFLLRRVLWRENHFGRLNQNSIGHSTFTSRIANGSTTALFNNWKVWPLVQLVNFKV